MLKGLTVFVLAILLFSSQAFSQETKKTLTDKALVLYQQGKFEKAIELAEKVVEMEKDDKSADTLSYAISLINAARMKQGYLVVMQNKLDDKNLTVREKIEIYKKNSEIADDIETLLRQALKLNESGGRAQTGQTADVKSELAMLVQKYNPAAKPSVENARGRIDEAEKLLTESLALNEQVRGKDADQTLAVVLQTGDFYKRYVNLEKALPFYERYIQTTEKKGAKNYPDLVNALQSYASILYATYQDKETADAIKKLEEITQKKQVDGFDGFNFQVRSKDAVAHSSRISQNLPARNINPSVKVVRVPVKVVIDENGKVIEATADDKDKKLSLKAEQEVSKWVVRPFSYNGKTYKLRGTLTYSEIK